MCLRSEVYCVCLGYYDIVGPDKQLAFLARVRLECLNAFAYSSLARGEGTLWTLGASMMGSRSADQTEEPLRLEPELVQTVGEWGVRSPLVPSYCVRNSGWGTGLTLKNVWRAV